MAPTYNYVHQRRGMCLKGISTWEDVNGGIRLSLAEEEEAEQRDKGGGRGGTVKIAAAALGMYFSRTFLRFRCSRAAWTLEIFPLSCRAHCMIACFTAATISSMSSPMYSFPAPCGEAQPGKGLQSQRRGFLPGR